MKRHNDSGLIQRVVGIWRQAGPPPQQKAKDPNGPRDGDSPGTADPATPDVAPWVRRGGPVIAGTGLLAYLVAYAHWPAMVEQVDVQVYRFAAMRLRNGLDICSLGLTGNRTELLFIYSPFAALCFLPMALAGQSVVQLGSLLSASILVTYTVWRILRSLGMTRTGGLWSLTALGVGLIGWLEPVRLSVQLGQINLAIVAIVVADLLAPRHRKWAGIGIGLVTGIKLTPALFIIYLVCVGRPRAAAVACSTLAVTVGVGFAVLPTDSTHYWIQRGFADISRISGDPLVNTSVRGLFQRLHYPSLLAAVATVGIAVVALSVAVIAHRRGHVVLGMTVVGMAASAVSPFSWSHHWVWFAPLVTYLIYRGYALRSTCAAWALWLVCAVVGGWFTAWNSANPQAGLLSLGLFGPWREALPAVYVAVFLVVLIVTAVWLRRSTTITAAGHDLVAAGATIPTVPPT